MYLRLFAAASVASMVSLMAGGSQAAVVQLSFSAPGEDQTAFSATTPATGDVGGQQLGAAKTSIPLILVPPDAIAVPEPATWALMLVGFGGMGAILRRRRQLGPIAA
jgi:hypothetical protein